jgi:hypothetical protein
MIEDHSSAVEDFTVVIKKNPKNAHAYFRRAFSNKALKVKILCINILFRNMPRLLMILKRLRSWIR